MQDYRSKTTLPYTPEQLFDIVIDVESYPEFLPWCLSSKVINRTDKYNFVANLNVGYNNLLYLIDQTTNSYRPLQKNFYK